MTGIELQRLIDALPDNAGTIRLDRGVIDLGVTSLGVRGPMRLVGDGVDSTVLRYAGPRAAIRVNDAKGVRTHGFMLDRFTIDCAKRGAYGIEFGLPHPPAGRAPARSSSRSGW